jgi:hypothetical protein
MLTKDEKEGPPRRRHGSTSDTPPPAQQDRPRPWSDKLSSELLDDLEAWNDACAAGGAATRTLRERGRDLAIRVQDELGTNGWEVLYQMGERMFRVYPPGSWPVESWEQELLGYRPPDTEPPDDPQKQ